MKSLAYLPMDIITEILLRVPIKSLSRFKCVCKSWLSTISNPNFIKRQFHHAIIASRNHPTLVIVINLSRYFGVEEKHKQRHREIINQAFLDTNGQDLSTSPVHFTRIRIPEFLYGFRVISCYNGIFCLHEDHFAGNRFCLWNPLIRRFKILCFPHPRISKYGNHNSGGGILMLFGYEDISNDYTVIRILYEKYSGDFPIVQVYSTNAACFNEFHAPVLKHLMENMQVENKLTKMARTNIVINRVLYFDGGDELVSFDLQEEVFRLVQFPSLIQRRKRSDVLDFEGSLAMVFESGPGVVDLWTLDDVSEKLSWTKKFSFEDGLDDSETEIWLSCYLGAGQFYGTKLLNQNCFLYAILYDYEKKKETKCYGLREYYYANFITRHATYKYIETVVSVDGFEEEENAMEDTF